MSDMIDHPEAYFRKFLPDREPLLLDLEKEAEREEIPIVGPVVGELLHVLTKATQAERILELGTATGYSTIFLARALSSSGRLVTVENDPDMAARAKANFEKAGLVRQIDIVVGEAEDKLAEMADVFDFIFLDIDKEYYAALLNHCHRLLKLGGLLVADNVGFRDADPFNRLIYDSSKWRSVSLYAYLPFHSPEKDGLCLAVRC